MKKRFVFSKFFQALFLKNYFLFYPALIFFIAGFWVEILITFGLILLMIDIVLSFIKGISSKQTLGVPSDPNEFNLDEIPKEVIDLAIQRCEEEMKFLEEASEMHMSATAKTLRSNLKKEMSFEEILDQFVKECNAVKVEGNLYRYEIKDTYNEQELITISLIFQYQKLDYFKELYVDVSYPNIFDDIEYNKETFSTESELISFLKWEIIINQIVEKNVDCVEIKVYEDVL